MTADEQMVHQNKVLAAAKLREKRRKVEARKNAKASDYSQSFSGSAEDTKTEKDFAEMMTGEAPIKRVTQMMTSSVLLRVTPKNYPSWKKLENG